MRDRITAATRRPLAIFAGFSPGQKAVTLVAVLALVIGSYFFSQWAAQPAYAPLFTSLSSTDASAIVDKLSAGGTPYKLADGGQTILVPQDKVYDLRLKMSGAGLPANASTGYALLDKTGVSTSDFMQHVDYQRALEGEIAKTIETIGGVKAAVVHLAIPQQNVFADDQQKPTASVLVSMGTDSKLNTSQVQAIVHLVASSVVGLDPSKVTVADSTGGVLSTAGQDIGTSAVGATREQATQSYQNRLGSSLQQMLDQVVGPGHAVVTVTADLDFDNTNTKTQSYVADPKLPALSQSKSTETYSGGSGATGGVLGPDNIAVPTGTGGTGKYAKTNETKDNAVGMVTEVRQSAPGQVKRMSVAVLLDSKTARNVSSSSVSGLITSAAGVDAKRGDTINVTQLPFDDTAAKQTRSALAGAKKAQQSQGMYSLIKTGLLVLAVILLIVGALLAGRRKQRSELSPAELEELEGMQLSLERARTRQLEPGIQRAALNAAPVTPESAARAARSSDITALMDRQPDEVAQLLRGWLADRRA